MESVIKRTENFEVGRQPVTICNRLETLVILFQQPIDGFRCREFQLSQSMGHLKWNCNNRYSKNQTVTNCHGLKLISISVDYKL
jgi:hypothetical protein